MIPRSFSFSKRSLISLNRHFIQYSDSVRCSSSSQKIVKSLLPDIELPNCNLRDVLWKNLHKWPTKTAVECCVTGRKYNYEDLYARCRALAANLRFKLKLNDGDTIAIVLPNVPEFAIALIGASQANLIVTTVNPLYTPEEIHRQILSSDSKCVITLEDWYGTVKKATESFKTNIPIITLNTSNNGISVDAINFWEFCNKSTDVSMLDKLENRAPDDVLFLPYSSGTTGLPKGVELTQKSVVSNLIQMSTSDTCIIEETTGSYQEVIPVVLPMFHLYGLMILLVDKLSYGCKLVSLPNFTSHEYISMLKKYKPSILYIVPPIVNLMSQHKDITDEDLKNVRYIHSAAAPLGAKDVERFLNKTKIDFKFIQAYGLTETSPMLTISHKKMPINDYATVGGLIPNTEAQFIDLETGRPLGPSESGELIVRGPQIMKGYHNNPKATKETIREDGWMHTGDIGYYKENGAFYITDRCKELIKVKGYQVAPAELEEVLRSNPNISDAAVIGVPDERSGEVPRAFVVLHAGKSPNEKQIQEFVNKKVAPYKQIAGGITFVDAIPKNPSGKIMRRQLKAQFNL